MGWAERCVCGGGGESNGLFPCNVLASFNFLFFTSFFFFFFIYIIFSIFLFFYI